MTPDTFKRRMFDRARRRDTVIDAADRLVGYWDGTGRRFESTSPEAELKHAVYEWRRAGR